jgi:hypothetical protein
MLNANVNVLINRNKASIIPETIFLSIFFFSLSPSLHFSNKRLQTIKQSSSSASQTLSAEASQAARESLPLPSLNTCFIIL